MTLLIALMISNSFAADPCEKAVQRAEKTGAITFGGGDWSVVHSDSDTRYKTTVFREGLGPPLKAGWTMATKLDDGTTLQLAIAEQADGLSRTDATGSFTHYEPSFVIPAEQVTALATSPMDAYRADLGSGGNVKPVPGARAKKIHAAFQCIAAQSEAEVASN